MKVIQISRHGPPEVLTCVEAPVRQPEAHEVLVKVHAIGVGIPDISIRAGTYRWMPQLPVVPGSELSGTVEATGSAVKALRIGDRVLMSARENHERGGCYAEFVTTAAEGLFPLPAGIDMAGAATLSNYQLVRLLTTDAAAVRSGQTILVYAAAGGVGSALVDVASRAGVTVIGVAKGEDKAASVRAIGATRAVNRARESVPQVVADVTDGRGVDVIFDSVGGPGFPGNIALLGHLGQLVSYGALDGPPQGDLLAAMREHRHKVPAVRTFSIHAYDDRPQVRRGAMTWAIEQLAQGKIRPVIHVKLPLAEAKTAHEMLETGRTVGKVLLQP
jgi:NADPH2:quinone reductase